MRARVLCLLVLGCAKSGSAPSLLGMSPEQGPSESAVEVLIRAENLSPRLFTDFSSKKTSVLDRRFTARLGRELLENVALNDDGSLSATVPAGLAAGFYDLSVIDPQGHTLVLARAYRVLAPAELGELVVGYRFDAIGPQLTGVPFSVTVTAIDAAGAAVESFRGVVHLSDRTGSVVPNEAGRFVKGRWVGLVEVRGLRPDDALTATDDRGKAGSSNDFAVSAGPGTVLRFGTPARAARAEDCSQKVTVQRVDATGSPSVGAPLPLKLEALPTAGFALFSDAACSVPLAAPALASGASALDFFFKGTRAGAVELAATATGLGAARQQQTITAGPAAKLVFVTPEPTLNAGTCSQKATVEARDAFDNAATQGAGLAIDLSATPSAGFTFFGQSDCTGGAIAQAQVPAGSARADLYYRGNTAGMLVVTGHAPGLTDATQQVRINPQGFATQVAIISSPQTVTVGACSGQVAVQTQDALGNAVTDPGTIPVSLAAVPATGFTFFSDPACTSPVTGLVLGGTKGIDLVYFIGTHAGSVSVQATAPGLQGAQQTETLLPAAPAALVFASAAQTVTAGTCSGEVLVELRDSLGNAATVMADTALSFSAAPASGFTFYSDASCTTAASSATVSAGAGVARVYFRGTLKGSVAATASAPGLTGAQQVEVVDPAAPAQLAFVTPPQSLSVGQCSAGATVELRDGFGNAADAASAISASLAAAPAAGFSLFSDASCSTPATAVSIAAGASSGTFFFRGTVAADVTLTATAPTWMPAQQVETLVAGAPTVLVFATAARVVSSGACSAAVTIESRDGSGNVSPVSSDTTATYSAAPAGSVSFFSDSSCTTASTTATLLSGTSQATLYFRGVVAGAAVVTATAAGLGPVQQTETVNPGTPAALAFLTPPRTATAGACSAAVDVAQQDAQGNSVAPASAVSVMLSAAPAAGFTFYSDAACASAVTSVSIAAGTPSGSLYFRGTAAGPVTLTAQSSGLSNATQGATITAAASPTQLVFTTPPRTATAGQCSSVLSVQTRDSFNNPRAVTSNATINLAGTPAAGFALYSDSGCTTAVTSMVLATGLDTLSFYARGTAAAAVSVTASATGLNPASQTVTVQTAPPDRLVFTTSAQALTVGSCSAIATVQTRDPFNNVSAPAAAVTVNLSSGAGVTFYSDSSCTTAITQRTVAAGGTTTSFYFRGTQIGSRTLTAAATGYTAANQSATFNGGPPTQLAFTTPARTVAAGTCSQVLTVETRDAFNNVSNVSAALTVALGAVPPAGFTFYGDSGCVTALTQVTVAAGSSAASFYVGGTAPGMVAMTASAVGFSAAIQGATVTAGAPSQIVMTTPARTAAAGACSAVVSIAIRDAFGNASPVATSTAVGLGASPAAGFAFYSDAACAVAVTQVTVATGASAASFYFRGTAAGAVTITASSAGLTDGTQGETVTAGAANKLSWDPVASPKAIGVAFGVTVRALDQFNNPATSYVGTAALSIAPAGTVSCTSSCTNATTTGAFVAGVWNGNLTLGGATGTGRTLTATAGAMNGTSNAFDTSGPASRTPPRAKFTLSARVIVAGQAITFDASSSSDYQTPAASLEVSWDFTGAAAGAPPWSAWTTAKSVMNTFNTAGTYVVRLAVRDADNDIGYAQGTVIVLASNTTLCVVNTSTDVDDGASTCQGAALGTDGKLSFREAMRLSDSQGGKHTITFSQPMTISSSGQFNVKEDLDIVAPSGVTLVGATFRTNGANRDLRIIGLEMTGQTQTLSHSSNNTTLSLIEVYLHDARGVVCDEKLIIDHSEFEACVSGPCIDKPGGSGQMTVKHSHLRGSGGTSVGIRLQGCSGQALNLRSTVFSGLGTGVAMLCGGTALIRHNTFVGNTTGIDYQAGANHVLVNNIFTGNAAAALCTAGTFTTRSHHLLFGNTATNCLAGDANGLTQDPLYAFGSSSDFRLSFSSPAKDSATDLGLKVTDSGPGNYLGAAPDRGGRETY